jgi:hypothetical protein
MSKKTKILFLLLISAMRLPLFGSGSIRLGMELSQLNDVKITAPDSNEFLVYDSATGKWFNQTPSEAGLDDIYVNLDSETTNITNGTFDMNTTGTLEGMAKVDTTLLTAYNNTIEHLVNSTGTSNILLFAVEARDTDATMLRTGIFVAEQSGERNSTLLNAITGSGRIKPVGSTTVQAMTGVRGNVHFVQEVNDVNTTFASGDGKGAFAFNGNININQSSGSAILNVPVVAVYHAGKPEVTASDGTITMPNGYAFFDEGQDVNGLYTNAWGLGTHSPNNFMAGSLSLGKSTAPTEVLDVNGDCIINGHSAFGSSGSVNTSYVIDITESMSVNSARGLSCDITYIKTSPPTVSLSSISTTATYQPPTGDRTLTTLTSGNFVTELATDASATNSPVVNTASGILAQLRVTRGAGASGTPTINSGRLFNATAATVSDGVITDLYSYYDAGQTVGTNNWSYYNAGDANSFMGNDGAREYKGTGKDVSDYFDGSNWWFKLNETGTNEMRIGDGGANYTAHEGDGSLEFNGTARWNPQKIDANGVAISGFTSANSVSDLQSHNDGSTYIATEATGSTNYMIVDFINVTAFNWIQILNYYDGSSTHGMDIQVEIAPFDESTWHSLDCMQHSPATTHCFENHSFFISDDSIYINSGVVKIKFLHMGSTANGHKLVIDEVALYQ